MDEFLLEGGIVLHNLCSPELESQHVCALAELQVVALQGFVLKEYEVKLLIVICWDCFHFCMLRIAYC